MARRIITARDQVSMLAPRLDPWLREAFLKESRYPQEWRGEAPYGYLPSGRARNRPPSVLRDPDDPDAGIIDPSEIRYERYGDSMSAFHPNGDLMGNYSWEEDDYGGHPHIGIAQVNPQYQGQGVGNAIIDHIREHHEPDLVHSGYQGNGSLSYQGRAGALRDLGNTEEEHNDYFNTRPYNYGDSSPSQFYVTNPDTKTREMFPVTDAQRKAHLELMKQFEEDRKHPNYTGATSSGGSGDPDMVDEYGDRHEYGYDPDGNYVGRTNGTKDSEGYSERGYNSRGYNREGYDEDGYDEDGYDDYGYHRDTGLNRDGETRHGYTPGGGQPPEGTVPMSEMESHWAKHGFPIPSEKHLRMMEDASEGRMPTMYAVREPGQVSPDTGAHHVGNGDTLYSSLDRARQVAYHPDDPSQDKNIVSVDNLNPDELHTDASGATPEDFHYAPVSGEWDAEDTASTEANIVHDPQRHQRILGDLGNGWSQSTMPPLVDHSGMEYTNPDSGRSGRMYLADNGSWWAEHQPEFGGRKRSNHDNYRDAAAAIREGTRPGPTMDQHALEVNNDYDASGEGEVDWQPHPNGRGLMAHTPHGDLHLTQDPNTGRWGWDAGPHGSQPGDEGNLRSMIPGGFTNATSAAETGIQALTRSPFHGGLGDELGEGWGPHPTAQGAYSQRLPSGNHAFVRRNVDTGNYISGIQSDNGRGQPYASPRYLRESPDLAQAKAFIQHRENPVPASELGDGWGDVDDLGPRYFPSYFHVNHPSRAAGTVAWSSDEGGGWKPTVHFNEKMFPGPVHGTPQEAAAWANRTMDSFGKPAAQL